MLRVRQALNGHGFPSQNALAVSLGLSRATITSFFNGKRIAHINFVEISERLGLNWEDIVYKEELDNPELDSKQPCIPNTTRELVERRTKMLLAKSSWELQVVLYEIDEFLARYPNNTEARLLKHTVLKASLKHSKVKTSPHPLSGTYRSDDFIPSEGVEKEPKRIRFNLTFLWILLATASLLYLLYFFVRLILEILK